MGIGSVESVADSTRMSRLEQVSSTPRLCRSRCRRVNISVSRTTLSLTWLSQYLFHEILHFPISRVGEYLGYCIGDTQNYSIFRNCIVTEIHFQNWECIVTWGYLRVGKVTILLSKHLAGCWPGWRPPSPQMFVSNCRLGSYISVSGEWGWERKILVTCIIIHFLGFLEFLNISILKSIGTVSFK